jgi:predicted DNA-binding protein (MmcQ/YjbR family)
MTEATYPPVLLPPSPFAARVQAHCLSFPEAYEDYPWGQVSYKVGKKLFASFSGIPVDKDNPLRLTVKADPHDAEFLREMPGIHPASHVGRYGWVTIAITD